MGILLIDGNFTSQTIPLAMGRDHFCICLQLSRLVSFMMNYDHSIPVTRFVFCRLGRCIFYALGNKETRYR